METRQRRPLIGMPETAREWSAAGFFIASILLGLDKLLTGSAILEFVWESFTGDIPDAKWAQGARAIGLPLLIIGAVIALTAPKKS